MTLASTMNAGDLFMVIQNGNNKKTTLTNILKNLNSNDSIRFNNNQFAIDTSFASKNDSHALVIKGSTDKVGIGTNSPQSKLHVRGNIQVGSSVDGLDGDGIFIQSSEVITYTSDNQTTSFVAPISPARSLTILNCNAGVSGQFSLSAGSNGQVKTIVQNTLDAGKTSTISFTGLGATTITFKKTGDSITLQYNTSIAKWIILSNGIQLYAPDTVWSSRYGISG